MHHLRQFSTCNSGFFLIETFLRFLKYEWFSMVYLYLVYLMIRITWSLLFNVTLIGILWFSRWKIGSRRESKIPKNPLCRQIIPSIFLIQHQRASSNYQMKNWGESDHNTDRHIEFAFQFDMLMLNEAEIFRRLILMLINIPNVINNRENCIHQIIKLAHFNVYW
jgi:hypothetical protein